MPLLRLKFLFVLIILAFTGNAVAQTARVRVQVSPPEAYVFADNHAMGSGHRALDLTPGRHIIGVYNYGFKPMVREVELTPGHNRDLVFNLERVGESVSGPFGVIQIEGAPQAAVLLNGKQPEYFVGHGDEFNNHNGWKQQLLVQPGTHEVTLLWGDKELWTGKVEVPANQRVVIYAVYPDQPHIAVKDWPEGASYKSAPRFSAGIASTTVAVAPVVAQMAVEPKQINCSEPAKLAWTTTDALHNTVSGDADHFRESALMGERTVSPRQTTKYGLMASGQGGAATGADTLHVNPEIDASLNNPAEAHYLKVGDTVLRQDPTTLTWSTSNADQVRLDPIGKVNASGSETLKLAPEKASSGAIDETRSYKLVASNVCGGSATREATVRLVGLVEPMISSVFFPTAYPDRNHPNKGLLVSQQEELKRIATVFKAYQEGVPDARLNLIGLADQRGTRPYNQRLSERRLAIVKNFLVSQGIAADAITGVAKGKDTQLDRAAVEQLEATNPQQPANHKLSARAKWLAYNRRVDVAVEPVAMESARFYPHQATDAQLLYAPVPASEAKIHQASSAEAVVASK